MLGSGISQKFCKRLGPKKVASTSDSKLCFWAEQNSNLRPYISPVPKICDVEWSTRSSENMLVEVRMKILEAAYVFTQQSCSLTGRKFRISLSSLLSDPFAGWKRTNGDSVYHFWGKSKMALLATSTKCGNGLIWRIAPLLTGDPK